MQWGIQLKAPSHDVIWVSDLQNSKANQPKSYVMNYNKSYHKKRETIIYQYTEKTVTAYQNRIFISLEV